VGVCFGLCDEGGISTTPPLHSSKDEVTILSCLTIASKNAPHFLPIFMAEQLNRIGGGFVSLSAWPLLNDELSELFERRIMADGESERTSHRLRLATETRVHFAAQVDESV
jgi:hypothetical protein